MEAKEYAQQIVDELPYLPKEKIIEVADFVHFLREKEHHNKITLHEAGLTRTDFEMFIFINVDKRVEEKTDDGRQRTEDKRS